MQGRPNYELPPGFRFRPTDEELIMYYLRNQATSKPCPFSIIPEVDVYKFDPWQLPDKAKFEENEWYLFSPRDRKYPKGARPNRATASGFWKATGTDRAIHSGTKYVGVKRALVFYKGKPPKGVKTEWIMHEYRLNESKKQATKKNGSMRLDDWVLCKIYRNRHMSRHMEDKMEETMETTLDTTPASDFNEQQLPKFPRTWSLSYLGDFEYMASMSQLLDDDTYYQNLDVQNMMVDSGSNHVEEIELGEFPLNQYTEIGLESLASY